MQRLTQTDNTSSWSSGLYDQEATRQILARAAELEQQKSDQLTADQIEALGRELGIDPQAVRRAIGEREGMLSETHTSRIGSGVAPLTTRNLWRACVPALYQILMVSLFVGGLVSVYPNQLPFFAEAFLIAATFVLPVVSAFWNGRRLRDWRLALIAGGLGTTLLYTVSILVICSVTHVWNPLPPLFFMIIIGMAMLTGAAGAIGAATGEEKVRKPAVRVSARDTDR